MSATPGPQQRSLATAALLCLLVSPASAAPGDAAFARAERAAERGRATAGWRALAQAARHRPADPRLALLGARLLGPASPEPPGETLRLRARFVRQAVQAAREGAAPPETRRPLGRADAWARALLGDHRGAVADARNWLGVEDPEGAALLGQLAVLAIHRDDLPAASEALLRAQRAMPQEPGWRRDLAAVELARGRSESAIAQLRRSLAFDADDPEARSDLAGALAAAGRLSEAAELWATLAREAAAAGDSDGARRRALAGAEVWLEAGRASEAARLAHAYRGPGDDGRAARIEGLALARLGRRREARAALEDAAGRDPDDLQARQALGALVPVPGP